MGHKWRYWFKMKEYEKAKRKLEEAEDKLIKKIDAIKDDFSGFDTVYEKNGNFYGEVNDNFNKRSEEVSDKIKDLITSIEEIHYTVLKNARGADRLYEHYRDLYNSEK